MKVFEPTGGRVEFVPGDIVKGGSFVWVRTVHGWVTIAIHSDHIASGENTSINDDVFEADRLRVVPTCTYLTEDKS